MSRRIIANIVLFSILFLNPLAGHSVEVEYGFPDSLQELIFWDEEGDFVGLADKAGDSSVPVIIVTPENAQVDSLVVYDIDVILPHVGIPKLGGLAFKFPGGFGLDRIIDIEYSDDYQGEDLEIRRAFVIGNIIIIFFKWGLSPPPGTEITLTVTSIRNPTLSGEYRIAGLIFNKWFRIESGPAFSESFEIFPGEPTSLSITPDYPIALKAGHSQLFTAVAIDRFGNEISDTGFTWSLSSAFDSIGIVSEGSFFATTVGVGKILVSSGELSAQSGLITVLPGDIDHFQITDFPPAVQAGEPFPSPVTVKCRDAFGNLKTDYDSYIYFTSTDPLADFFYNESNKYKFTEADSGVRSFEGSLFSLVTTGQQTITVTDGEHRGTSGVILVAGGPLASFTLHFSEHATAGYSFVISVTDAQDSFGNPAAGVIELTLIQGGPSPSGLEPILNDIIVQDGAGSAEQFFYKTGLTILRASAGSIVHDISFDVLPAGLGNLVLDIQPTQFAANPIIGPATVTAIDLFGNIKTDFDASLSPVTLFVDRGELTPEILDGADDFVDGVADLGLKTIVYAGDPGENRFSVSSGDIVSPKSDLIFNGIAFDSYEIPDSIFSGTIFRFRANVVNNGNLVPQEPVVLSGYFQSCEMLCAGLSETSPILPGEMVEMSAELPTELLEAETEDTIYAGLESHYLYDGKTIKVVISISKPFLVISRPDVDYVQNSMSIDTLLAPSELDSIDFKFTINDDVDLIPDVSISEMFLHLNSTDTIALFFDSQSDMHVGNIATVRLYGLKIPDLTVYSPFSDGEKALDVELLVVYEDDNVLIENFEKFDSAFVAGLAELAYVENSIKPKIAPAGEGQAFEFDVTLDGSTAIRLDPCQSRFELLYNDSKISDVCLLDSLTLLPGLNNLTTRQILIPDSLADMELTPRLVLSGREVYLARIDTILFGEEVIHVSDLPRLKISSADLITLNPPFVNYDQEFSVVASIANLSGSAVEDVSLFIQSEDGSQIFAEVHGLIVPAASSLDTALELIAPACSIPSVIYRAVISAPGVIVLPPDDNTIAVTVQSPAEIELSADLQGAFGNYVDFGQLFFVEVSLENLGEAGVGRGEISLLTGGVDFGIPDSSAISLPVDSTGEFELVAPSVILSTDLIAKITDIPVDKNTGLPAAVKTGADTLHVVIQPGLAELIVDGSVNQAPLIVEGTTRNLFSLELLNHTENPLNVVGLKFITIPMADRYDRLISPDHILSVEESGFYLRDQLLTTGEIHESKLRLRFEDYHLSPGVTDTIVFRARFNDDLSIEGFSLSIDSRDVNAVFLTGPRAGLPVNVRGKTEDIFRLSSNFVVAAPTLEKSLMVKNNPFNPDDGPMEIGYILEEDTDIRMTIYTLTGEEVYERSISWGSDGGRQGQNYISWDGSNDDGKTVLNGVYVLVIKPGSGDRSFKLKVAVMK